MVEEPFVPEGNYVPPAPAPKENKFFAGLKNFLIFLFLVVVVGASFWVSFQLGKRILIPVKKFPERRIEVAIPEPPPSLKALQELEKAMVSSPEVLGEKLPPRKKAATARVSRRAVKHYYKVQAGLYQDKELARKLAERLEASGFESYLKKVKTGWRVQVGAFRTRSAAEALQKTLKGKGFKSLIIYE